LGSVSEHIRRAIDQYIERLTPKSSKSPSKLLRKDNMKKTVKKKTIAEVKVSKEFGARIKESSTSPVPTKKIEMLTFADAIREMLNGKRMTRIAWNTINTYIFMKGEYLTIHIDKCTDCKGECKEHNLIVSIGDLEGIDWYAIPSSN